MEIVDVSNNNGQINFASLKQHGVGGVFVKATEGADYVSPTLKQQFGDAAAAGLIVGTYHFARQENRPNPAGAVTEADHYINTMKSINGAHAWRAGQFIPVLDFETGTPDKQYSGWRDAFFKRVRDVTGHSGMLYTYTSFNTWAPPVDDHRLWIANYGASPGLPGGYHHWDLWQHTDKGNFGGVSLDASRLPDASSIERIKCHADG